MKIAYNACYGGFSLSPEGLTLYAKKKGIDLVWYHKDYRTKKVTKLNNMADASSWSCEAYTEDFGDNPKELLEDYFYYPSFYDNESRTDKDLIAVIEELGEKASGDCSNLQIAEIPDGADFEITEYDGFEDVVPPRMSW